MHLSCGAPGRRCALRGKPGRPYRADRLTLAGELRIDPKGGGNARPPRARQKPPDLEQARVAAEARLRYPLNLGDCFAYALAKMERLAILTLDSDSRRLDPRV